MCKSIKILRRGKIFLYVLQHLFPNCLIVNIKKSCTKKRDTKAALFHFMTIVFLIIFQSICHHLLMHSIQCRIQNFAAKVHYFLHICNKFCIFVAKTMIYGYIRVSSDKQTVENQRFEIERFCKVNNLHIDGWIEKKRSPAQKLTTNGSWGYY